VLANSEVGKVPSDLSLIGQDLLACGTSKASPLTHNASHTSTNSLLETNSLPSQYLKDDLGTGATVKVEDADAESGQDQAVRLKEQGPLCTNKSTKLRGKFAFSLSYSHYPHLLLQARR
jgi:hypothetical protein